MYKITTQSLICFDMDVFLIRPRGFCFGVKRAINIVLKTLEEYSSPIFVLNEIVHNPVVIKSLEEKGVKFINDLKELSNNKCNLSRIILIVPSHGVSPIIIEEAKKMGVSCIDATCPFVKKIHHKAKKYNLLGYSIIIIGNKNHQEIIGISGNIDINNLFFVENESDIDDLPENLSVKKLTYVTQTTLSINKAKIIISLLRKKFPNLECNNNDICYATTERQNAVISAANITDKIVIIGGKNSSNSNKLRDIAIESGCSDSRLIIDFKELDDDFFKGLKSLGVSSGASTPEDLVKKFIDDLSENYNINIIKNCYKL